MRVNLLGLRLLGHVSRVTKEASVGSDAVLLSLLGLLVRLWCLVQFGSFEQCCPGLLFLLTTSQLASIILSFLCEEVEQREVK